MGITILGGFVLSLVAILYVFIATREQRVNWLICEDTYVRLDKLCKKYIDKEDPCLTQPIHTWSMNDIEKYAEFCETIDLYEKEQAKLSKRTKIMYLPFCWVLVVGVLITGVIVTGLGYYGQTINRYIVEQVILDESSGNFVIHFSDRNEIVIPIEKVFYSYNAPEGPYAMISGRFGVEADFWRWPVSERLDKVELFLTDQYAF